MTMHLRNLRTHKGLWVAASASVFILLGFVDFVPEGKGGLQYWRWWAVLLSGNYPWERFVTPLTMMALMLAIPSLLLGWVMQALFVVVAAYLRQRKSPTRESQQFLTAANKKQS
jgi:hypothetical protein